jgi:hypothetical protein
MIGFGARRRGLSESRAREGGGARRIGDAARVNVGPLIAPRSTGSIMEDARGSRVEAGVGED